MIRVIKAPHLIDPLLNQGWMTIFLAGTIDMGNSHDWQFDFTAQLANNGRYCILNPRRNDWDSSWTQEASNPQFREQVEWELHALQHADWIVMHLGKDSKSPISLLELGLHASSHKLLVHCEEGFYRKGNVDIVCEKYDIRQFKSLEEIIKFLTK